MTTGKNFEYIQGNLLQRTKWRFFFKTEFWRKVTINHYNDEIFEMKIYFEPPSMLVGIIGHFEEKMCETLDLMTENTLCRPKDYPWLWMTVKLTLMNFDEL